DLKTPRKHKRDRQPDDNEKDNQPDHPVRNIKDWKNLRDSLRKRPAADDVRNRNLINVASLQLGEEIHALGMLCDAIISVGRRPGPSCARTRSIAGRREDSV